MKSFIRIFVFLYVALYATQAVVNSLNYGPDPNITVLLMLVALTLINLFALPLFKILSLPSSGAGYLFLSFVLNLATLYILTILIPFFFVSAATLPELNIFGFVLPSKDLTATMSLVFSTLLLVLILNFFLWLSSSKK